jgi:peptidoglycan/xylan/chitin deacetylase (PgdA/CDA1 family)
MKKSICLIALLLLLLQCSDGQTVAAGKSEITEWPAGKQGAVSITYDDGSYHQFTIALPIMERLKLPATFFVITGGIPGSAYQGKFIGRPVKDIIDESASIPTDHKNFLERCSAGGYLGYKGTIGFVTKAASFYDEKDTLKAYHLMDELYSKVRNGGFVAGYQPCDEVLQENGLTWPALRRYAAEGYEIASHSITHASMPGLDSANIVYELEKSKADISKQMGRRYTFSTEVPYGYENERVMKIAYKIYPALRNRMPEPWLKEIDRPSRQTPGISDKDYIQWQREMNTRAPLPLMKSWVDTVAVRRDTWLVLVIHGVDGLGYEALPGSLLSQYFTYIKSFQDKLWIATFGDVAKYMRERENIKLSSRIIDGKIIVNMVNPLDHHFYDLPITIKTRVPASWAKVLVKQGRHRFITKTNKVSGELIYQADPNGGAVFLSNIR